MRIVFASLCLVAFAVGPASAQQQPQPAQPATPGVLDQVYACADIADETQRLACYDGAVGRLREAQNTGNLVAVDRHQAEEIQRDAFGFSLPSLPRLFGSRNNEGSTPARPAIGEVSEMELVVERVIQRGDGTAVFVMSNGQSWSQIDNESPRNVRAGGHVTIRRASLGSFLMHVDAGGPALRVRRSQ